MIMNQFVSAPQVSIIVPIFNTEKYLDRCVKSIVNQREGEIEIILVNDGSTDSSGSLCDEWEKIDSRIRVIHKKNEGVTIARKIGVECSSGEWICFVDSDDELPNKSVCTLFKYTRNDVDIIIGTIKYDGPAKWQYNLNYKENDSLQYLKLLLSNKVHTGPVARLMRRSIFDTSIFDVPSEFVHGEDFIMNIRLGQKARSVIFLPDIVYYYIFRAGSALASGHLFYIDKNYRILRKRLINESINCRYKKHLRLTLIMHNIRNQWWLLKFIVKKILRG